MEKQALVNGLKLYYKILKAHRFKLPGKMRRLGDLYVKSQFRQHFSNPSPHYYPKFYEQWLSYYKQLQQGGFMGVSRPLSDQNKKMLNSDQEQALKNLQSGLKKIK